jgi:hypothetical protein
MGMTAARLRERRAAELRNAPPPKPLLTVAEVHEQRRQECRELRAELATAKTRIAELEQQIEALTAPPAAKAEQPAPVPESRPVFEPQRQDAQRYDSSKNKSRRG